LNLTKVNSILDTLVKKLMKFYKFVYIFEFSFNVRCFKKPRYSKEFPLLIISRFSRNLLKKQFLKEVIEKIAERISRMKLKIKLH